MVERNIKFQYFGVVRQEKIKNRWKGKGKLNIYEWVDKVENRKLQKAILQLFDTKVQIERVKYFEDNNVWVFRFLKLREDNIPSIAKANEEAEGIRLGDDEYIGEDLHMLYDNESGISMVQMNRFSLGLKRLEELLTYVWNIENERIKLKPISEELNFQNVFGRRRYRSLEVDFANIDNQLDEGKNSLGRIMNSFRAFHGIVGHVKIGLGRTKRDTLNIDEVNQFITDAFNDASVVGLKLSIKDDDARPAEVIDLFDNICNSIITFRIAKKSVLQYDPVANEMIVNYNNIRQHLVELITPHE